VQQWRPEDIARAAGARLLAGEGVADGPTSVVIDSRQAGPGGLFVGLPGASEDGGRFAPPALAAGAWGALTTEEHARVAADASHSRPGGGGVIMAAKDPLRALQNLATEWRRELGAHVIGVTGSTGKTSTKDLLLGLLAPHRRTVASRANFNTEIGVPLEILGAPAGTEVLVLEMAMRGAGQIAELAAIAEPDVGVIVTIGPVHLELLGSIEAIAATKAELIAGLPAGRGTAIVPAGEALLEPHLRTDVKTVTFGEGGDVQLLSADGEHVTIGFDSRRYELDVPFTQAHLRTNLLAAVAAADAIGVTPSGRVEATLSPGRGQRVELPGGVTLIDDCYNANPMSMEAALDDLAATATSVAAGEQRRSVAVLGDMLELGPAERAYHVAIGEHAARTGVDVLVTVGPLAAAMADGFTGGGHVHATRDAGAAAGLLPDLVEPGDVVLVKASRGVGLELVCGALQTAEAMT
jgi:UDP-N-acetylmuramoyl-tripeptide--D-alanyl-D-alanine ligase